MSFVSMYKQRGEYLKRNQRFGELSFGVAVGVLVFFFIATVVVVILLYNWFGETNIFFPLVFLVLLGLAWLCYQIIPALTKSRGYSRNFAAGIAGENDVWRELHRLPGGYTAFANVVLPNRTGDIDFVVTGPSGIHIVETKNMAGQVEISAGQLFVGGRIPQRNIIGQAKSEAFGFSEFLSATVGVKIYVQPTLSFTRSRGVQRPQYLQGVWVVPTWQLATFLAKPQVNISARDLESINNILKLISKA